MRVLTAAEIRGLESCAVESGVSMETLMENAGAAVAAAVTEKMDVTGKKTVILCGKGNNGGDGFVAARYHSLIVEPESLPECLEVTAKTAKDEIMALQHKTLPVYGVQFHPESIMTPQGRTILKNFLSM